MECEYNRPLWVETLTAVFCVKIKMKTVVAILLAVNLVLIGCFFCFEKQEVKPEQNEKSVKLGNTSFQSNAHPELAGYPQLISHLQKAGYSEPEIQKIVSSQVARIFNQDREAAKSSSSGSSLTQKLKELDEEQKSFLDHLFQSIPSEVGIFSSDPVLASAAPAEKTSAPEEPEPSTPRPVHQHVPSDTPENKYQRDWGTDNFNRWQTQGEPGLTQK